MGLTHVAMRKLGFLFDIPCSLFYISLFREAQGCNKCLVLRGNVRSSFQVDFAAAAKGGGERGGGKAWKSQQGKAAQAPTFQASSGQPESHFAQPCHTLSAVCCSTGIVSLSSNRMAARRACSWPWHPPPPAKLSTFTSSSSSSRQHKGSLLRPPASHRSRPLTFSS